MENISTYVFISKNVDNLALKLHVGFKSGNNIIIYYFIHSFLHNIYLFLLSLFIFIYQLIRI
jgi:hypothetical protein